MKTLMDCCMPMPEPDPRYTQDKDWSLEGNRPRLCEPCDEMSANRTTEAKVASTGLTLRQPL